MTNVDVQFRYTQHPSDDTLRAVADLGQVYGIRRVRMHPAERTILVEYDATRLAAANVFQLLRRAGLSVIEEISSVPPPAAPEENKAPAA
jgi:copper chaperone CopZ